MNMFKTTASKTPEEYIASLEEPRKSEIIQIDSLIRKTVPNLKPYIISGMIGYGSYHYKYASGREGEWCILALASQKNYISVYACAVDSNGRYIAENCKDQLPTKDTTKKHGKISIGKSCIRFKSLEDLDRNILIKILKDAEKNPAFSAQ